VSYNDSQQLRYLFSDTAQSQGCHE